jgi:hypothetical protein
MGLLALSGLGFVCGILTVLTIRDKKTAAARDAGAGR